MYQQFISCALMSMPVGKVERTTFHVSKWEFIKIATFAQRTHLKCSYLNFKHFREMYLISDIMLVSLLMLRCAFRSISFVMEFLFCTFVWGCELSSVDLSPRNKISLSLLNVNPTFCWSFSIKLPPKLDLQLEFLSKLLLQLKKKIVSFVIFEYLPKNSQFPEEDLKLYFFDLE